MKTELGVGVAVLAALAAHGKNFDRATLNAMLEKLATSPEPMVRRGPMAMCYAPPRFIPIEIKYSCPKCGTVTRFMSVETEYHLAFLRDAAVSLKGMGLDIALDESPLCRACSPGPKMPRSGRMAKSIGTLVEGEEVIILRMDFCWVWVTPRKKGFWVSAKFVDREKSCITADSVRVRRQPGVNGKIVTKLNRGHKVKLLPAVKGDPIDWVHLEYETYNHDERGVEVSLKDLKDLSYGEGDFALEGRFSKVAWIINGKRTFATPSDVELLRTFLSGKLVLNEGGAEEVPLKWRIRRLRELLGGPKK